MEADLFGGLDSMGLKDLTEDLDVYEEEEEKKEEEAPAPVKKVTNEKKVTEADLVFDKTFTCPVCNEKFKSKMMRAGKAKSIGSDLDLRARYEVVDAMKYDILACPYCGYAGRQDNYTFLTPVQRKLIKENICESFVPRLSSWNDDTYTYEEDIERHKLALVSAIVKKGRASEKSFICLRTGWLYRGAAENLKKGPNYEKILAEYQRTEKQFLKSAYDGFIKARASEHYPICGMDESTLDYLLIALAIGFDEFDTAKSLMNQMLSNKATSSRIKNKIVELKELMQSKMENENPV